MHSEDESEACVVIKKNKIGKRSGENLCEQDADEALEESFETPEKIAEEIRRVFEEDNAKFRGEELERTPENKNEAKTRDRKR